MALDFKINCKPYRIKCLDCGAEFHTFVLLALHWNRSWHRPEIWGEHYKPRKSKNG